MYTLAIAGSRGRLSIVGVETITRTGDLYPHRVVTLHKRLAAQATPAEQHRAVVALAAKVRDDLNNGSEPRIIVMTGGAGTSLHALLREDHKAGRSREWPMPITTINGSGSNYIAPADLAAALYTEWENGRISFAPGLDKLRTQVAAFVPAETKAGNFGFGNPDMSDYDDAVVALMFALPVRGYGVRRYVDPFGNLWPSRELAEIRLGVLASTTGPEHVGDRWAR